MDKKGKTIMKTLQNNYTTPEQSKRLLELGVPADSADCYLLRTHTKGDTFIVEVLHDELYSKKDKFTNMLEYLPCWSVGRLIEIYNMCVDFDLDDGAAIVIFIQDEAPIVQMMQMFEDKVGIMAFSNLED